MSEPKKKPAAPKKAPEHPKYIDMIIAAITALKDRSGSSRQAIVKYVGANYKVGDTYESHLKQALKRGVVAGNITQAKGTGASGSFKLAKPASEVKKPAAKKPATKKKSSTKKPASKKPAAKKTTKKSTPKKSTTKKSTAKTSAKKPATKKSPAKKKPASKKPKKPAAKGKAKKPAKK